MSTTIDEKVVEMRFDNKQFESNVATSMSTLEKLKQKLNLSGASKGLEEINSAAKRVDMSGLGGAVDSVRARFSALDVVAVTALANITNSAVNAGKRLVASLSVDQVASGWQKFSDKTTSVATLVAQGNAIEDVNDQLDRLNWFTDETSYNFTDMVSNIAKFTATGKGLEESVTAMEGIATWAALSGQNAATASRAMYQLAGAMSAGAMRLEDYKSIQTASMDTEEFRQKCLDAGVALGTLKDNGDGTYKSLKANVKDGNFTLSQFANHLTADAWLTSDVMMKVFNEYSSAVSSIYEVTEEKGMLASEVIDEIHKRANELKTDGMSDSEAIDSAIRDLGYTLSDGSLRFDSFGLKAFEAGQKARTLRDAIDSVKDAVSTGWMNSFERIFGNAEQATELWTNVANQLWDIFAGGGERRNDILKMTMTSGWDQVKERVKAAGGEVETFEAKVKECAKAGGVNVDDLVKKYGSLSEAFKNGAINTKYLQDAFEGLKTGAQTTSKEVSKLFVDLDSIFAGRDGEKKNKLAMWDDDTESIKKLQTALVELGYPLKKYGIDGKYNWETFLAVKEFQKAVGILHTGVVDQATLDAMKEMAGTTVEITEGGIKADATIEDLLDKVARPSGRELVFDIIDNSLSGLVGVITTFREAWADTFEDTGVAEGIYNVLEAIKNFTDGLFEMDEEGNRVIKKYDELKRTFAGLIAVFDIVTNLVGSAVKSAFKAFSSVLKIFNFNILDSTASIGDMLVALRDWIAENNIFGKAFDWLFERLADGVSWLKDKFAEFLGSISNLGPIKAIIEAFKDFKDVLVKFKKGEVDIIAVGNAIGDFGLKILKTIPGFEEWLERLKETPRYQAWVKAFSELNAQIKAFINKETSLLDLAKAFGKFSKSILATIPSIKIWTGMFNNWLDSFKKLDVVERFVQSINAIHEAYKKLKEGRMSLGDFGTVLGENLGRAIASIPEIIKQFVKGFVSVGSEVASDFLQGFQNGIIAKVTEVVTSIVNFGTNFVSSFAEALGVHSPSWKAFEIAKDFLQGFINGIKAVIDTVVSVLRKVGERFVSVFKKVWEPIKKLCEQHGLTEIFTPPEESVIDAFVEFLGKVRDRVATALSNLWDSLPELSKKIEWDKVFALGSIIAIMYVANKITAAISNIAKAFTSFKIVFDGANDVLKSFSKVLKGIEWDFKAKALLSIAAAIGVLVAAVWVLSTIPKEKIGMLWNAVGVIGALAAIMLILAVLMDKMTSASIKIDKSGANLEGLKTGLTQIGAALILMALTVKIIGTLKPEEAKQGFIALAGIVVGILAFCAVLGKISSYSKDVDKFGSILVRISAAMFIMIFAMKLIAKMDPADLVIGTIVLEAFTLFCIQLGIANRFAGEHGQNFGGNVMKIAASLVIMTLAMKMIAKMDSGDILKAIGIVQLMVVLIGEMAIINRIAGEGKSKIGGTVMSMATSIMILASVLWMLKWLKDEDVDRGIKVIQKFASLIAEFALINRLAGKDASKIAGNMMGMAVAVGVLAGIAVMLSTIEDYESVNKGIATIMALGTVMALMAWATRGVQSIEKNFFAMSIAIAAMAGAAYALSKIEDPSKLKAATASLTILMFAFSVMTAISKTASISKSSFGAILAMTGVTIALTGLVITLSTLDAKSALPNAIALGTLMVALSASLWVMSKAGDISKDVSNQIGPMMAVAFVLSGIVAILSQIPAEASIPNAIALGILMNAMASSLFIMAKAGKMSKTVYDRLAPMVAVAIGLSFVLAIIAKIPIESAIPNAIALGILMNAMASSLFIMAKAGKMSKTVSDQLLPMTMVALGLSFVLAIIAKIPIESAIPNAIALGILMNSMASSLLIMAKAGKMSKTVSDQLLPMTMVAFGLAIVLGIMSTMEVEASIPNAIALGVLMNAMALACRIVAGIPAAAAMDGALGLAAFIAVMATVITALGILTQIPGFSEVIAGGGKTLALIGTAIGNFVGSIVGGVITGIGGAVISLLPMLGNALSDFMVGVQPFIALAGGVDFSVVAGAGFLTAAILALSGASFISGVTSILGLGTTSLAALGLQLWALGKGASSFAQSIEGIDSSAVDSATNLGNMILAITASEFISGLARLFGGGSIDYSTIGAKLSQFGEAVVAFSSEISGKIDTGAVEAAAKAGELLVALNKSLPRSGGFLQDIIGEKDFETFASSCKAFAECILGINAAISQNGFEVQSDKIEQLVKAGTMFSDLNNALPRSGGIAQDLAGEQDLSKFATSCTAFANAMLVINETLSSATVKIQSDKLAKLAEAGTKFNELNAALPRSGGVAQDLAGEQDLAAFGTACSAFASCMIKVNSAISQDGFSVNLEGMESLKQAGLKMNSLQEALPKTGGWIQTIAGESDIGDFGNKISAFGTAIVGFSNSATGLDVSGINLAMTTAYRIKHFVESLKDFDTSGVATFTGVGTGGFGADGPAYKIAKAISAFSDEISGIDTTTISIAITAANRLKTLISGLADLDTSGVSDFKPQNIGSAIKEYGDKVSGIDTGVVSSSISSANRLRVFIASLSGLDTSGINRFRVGSIATSLKQYNTTVSGLNFSTINNSITVANRLKTFISSLAGLNTGGVGQFSSAISQLASINLTSFTESFAGVSGQMSSFGGMITSGLAKGVTASKSILINAVSSMIKAALSKVKSQSGAFRSAGSALSSNLASGIRSGSSSVSSAAGSVASSANSAVRGYHDSLYKTGKYLMLGLGNGIYDNKDYVVNNAKIVAKAAANAINSELQVNSPSKVTMKSGASIDEGLALGMSKNTSMVVTSAKNVASNATTTIQDAVTKAGDLINSSVDAQPTIRPIVDLTDVKTGAAAVSGLFSNVQTVGVRSSLNSINVAMNSKLQNGSNDDIISAINKLGAGLENNRGGTYNLGGFTYDDGSEVAEAVGTLIRYAKIGRRV